MKFKSLVSMRVFVVFSLFPAMVSAQSTVKVSDAIEGGHSLGVSAARCGNSLVVGFSDAEPSRPNSFAGVSLSKDAGRHFSDLGTLPPTPNGGDPVAPDYPRYTLGTDSPSIACSGSGTFYYASGESIGHAVDVPYAAITVSASNDGRKWGLPAMASVATTDNYFLMSPSLAVDATNPMHLYVAYINVNGVTPQDFPGCEDSTLYILELTTSSDGGKTWNSPRVSPGQRGERGQLDHTCDGTGLDPEHTGKLAAPNVIVSRNGEVYITYELADQGFNGSPARNEIRFLRSTDHGATFSSPQNVSTEAVVNALPQLTVDRSGSSHRGTIYLTWAGSPSGTYTDALVSESTDSGVSFSFPRSIAPPPAAGAGRFQTNPVIAADNTGQVAACFYETPSNQPANNSVYSYNCATSINYAATWQLRRVADSVPVGYDAIASDALLGTSGFFTSFEISTNGTRSVLGTNIGSH